MCAFSCQPVARFSGAACRLPFKKDNQIVKDLDLLEKLRRAERNERTREEEPDEMAFCDKDDPLGLDGPILIGERNRSGTDRRHFDQNHVRITNGEIVEQHSGQDGARHQ